MSNPETAGRSALRSRKGRIGTGGLAALMTLGTLPVFATMGGTASAAVTVGENITAFPNRDMAVIVGYLPGEQLTVELVRDGVVIGTTAGPAVETPEGVGLEVNHGPLGAAQPGDCWTGYTPDMIPGDVIRVTTPRGIDTMTVADVNLPGAPYLDGTNVSIAGVGTANAAVEFRRDKPTPRFRRGPFPIVRDSDTPTSWTSTFRPSTTTSAEGLTPDQQRNIALNEASWMAVVDNITETTISEAGEPGGVAAGCTGTADPNNIGGGFAEPINIASGDITLSGTAREGVAAVTITVGSLPAKTATLSANATGTKTWSVDFTKAELSTLADGNVSVTPRFDGIAGGTRTIIKDTRAPAAPTATPGTGTYQTTQNVTLNRALGEVATSKVHYEIGGTAAATADPDAASPSFSTQIPVTASQAIKARVIDAGGNPSPIATFTYTFGPANTPPTVSGRGPATNATGVAIGSNVTATFSEAVTGVDGTTFSLSGPTGPVAASVTYNGTNRTATLDPTANLAPSTTYTANLTSGIVDTGGAALAPVSWSFTTGAGDITPPTVSGRAPAAGATAVAVGNNVTATFNEAVQGVSGTTFTLRAAGSTTNVAAAVTRNGTTNQYVLDPTANLAAGTTYTATLTGGATAIRDAANNALATTSWTFTTATGSANPAPTVSGRTPAVNGTAFPVANNVTATFNEGVTGVSGSTFTLRNAATGAPVGAVVSYNATTRVATLNPGASLSPDTRYTATLTGGSTAIRDLGTPASPLATTSWTFTTGPAPVISARTPGAGATGVRRTANVTATFSEPVQGVSGTTVRLRNAATGAQISAVVSYNATTRVVTLNPSVTLASGTRYTVALTGGATAIRDNAGNPLQNASWSFTTGTAL